METMPDLPEEAAEPAIAPAWEPLLPHLDRCLGKLPELDRRAIWLRFFEDRSLADVGQALGVAEDAARKRVRRALDRLQGLLRLEGARVGDGDLEPMLSSRPAAVVPAGLVSATVAAALGGTARGSATALADSVARTWAWLTWKPWVIGATALLATTAAIEAVRSPVIVPPGTVAAALDDYSVAGFPRPEPVRELVRGLQAGLVKRDISAVASLIRFPLRVNTANGPVEIADATQLEAQWSSVFTHKVSSLVLKSPATRLYCDSRGVMVGAGEVWIGAEKSADGAVKAVVTAINAR
jgi:hypothetical protein